MSRLLSWCLLVWWVLLQLSSLVWAETSIPLTPEERLFLKQYSHFVAHAERDYHPFVFVEKGRARGYAVDLTNLLAERLGIGVEYVTDETWDEGVDRLKKRQIDLVLAMVNTPERRRFAHFTEPFLTTYTGLATRKGESQGRELDEFAGRRVAVVEGYWHYALLKEHYPKVVPVVYHDNLACLEALSAGEVDAALSSNPVLTYLIRSHYMLGLESRPILGSEFFRSTREGYGVRIDFPLLASALQKAYDSLSESELNALRHRWLINPVAEAASLVLTEEETAHLKQLKELRLCIDPAWMPLEGLDSQGHYTGLTADYYELLQRQLPIPIRFVPTKSWLDTLDKARCGECDLLSLVSKTEDRSKFLNFTRPYLNLPIVVATRDEEIFIEDVQQIVGRRLGSTKGYAITEQFRRQYPSIDLVEVDTVTEGIRLVAQGKIYGFVGTVAAIGGAIRDQGLDRVKISGQLDLTLPLAIGVRKDDLLLRDIMDRAVAALGPAEGQRLYNKWVTVSYRQGVNLELVVWGGLIATGLILLIVLRNRKLAQLNREILDAKSQLEEKNRILERLSTTDQLTGLYNRLKLEESFLYEWKRERRYEQPLSLILLDLDHFKDVNDRYGHQQGDRVLVAVAEALKLRARQTDLVGRWGGEEFMIICPGTSLYETRILAEALRVAISQLDLHPVSGQTASFGVATLHPGDSEGDTFRRADKALYRAKDLGRNRVVAENE
ncbi:MAG: transporter substrate-binding domain-containing protein [Desulfuromonadaceae bacterium]|nr:transporter substrate-binding domain-containing protein [Desulfuromonadaceae bacterium]